MKEIDKLKEPPQIAVKFANTVFVLCILFSILLIVYAIYRIYNPPAGSSLAFDIVSILSGVVFATLFGFVLKRLSNNLKVNLSLLFFSVGITVYGFEIYLEFVENTRSYDGEIIAKKIGVPFDTRTKAEVLDDLNNSGIEAFPNVLPNLSIKSSVLTSKKSRIYPLGGISNITTIGENESGYYPIIETDEHGFNNPKGLYKENKVDIILTGDSFTEGFSVHSNESISAVLREIGFNAINIGKGNNGPLAELAALKEYAEPLEPKVVLWVYYVNDLNDLRKEMQSSIWIKYLNDDDYSQELISRQEEIDDMLKNYIQDEWVANMWHTKQKGYKVIINILKLTRLRIKLDLTPYSFPPTATPMTISIFRDILQKSKQMVSDWDGKMYFVYLPGFNKYSTGNQEEYHNIVMQTATELDIPIIDIHKEVFDPHPDPLSLFPFRLSNHYNAQGYKLVTEAIGKRLEKDGLLH